MLVQLPKSPLNYHLTILYQELVDQSQDSRVGLKDRVTGLVVAAALRKCTQSIHNHKIQQTMERLSLNRPITNIPKSIPKCWVSLTLFCRLGLQRAEMRILATPAWPYLAAVCRGVSPYCGGKNKT